MKTAEVYDLKKGDLLIYEPNGSQVPVLDINGSKFKTYLNGRTIERSINQLWKVRSKYIRVREGDVVLKDIAFYCPRTNQLIELKTGSVYLGIV